MLSLDLRGGLLSSGWIGAGQMLWLCRMRNDGHENVMYSKHSLSMASEEETLWAQHGLFVCVLAWDESDRPLLPW